MEGTVAGCARTQSTLWPTGLGSPIRDSSLGPHWSGEVEIYCEAGLGWTGLTPGGWRTGTFEVDDDELTAVVGSETTRLRLDARSSCAECDGGDAGPL